MNVQRLLILISLPLLISGCGITSLFQGPDVKTVEVQTRAVERTRLNIPMPDPMQARDVKFIIVTEENVAQVFQQLKDQGVDPVFFALTDDGYAQLALTIAEARNLIAAQRSIIIKYKEYYEPTQKND